MPKSGQWVFSWFIHNQMGENQMFYFLEKNLTGLKNLLGFSI